MTKWLAMLMACLALGLVVAACGDDDDDEGGDGGADSAQPGGPPGQAKDKGGKEEDGAAGAGETADVSLKDIAFNPATITVKAGTEVTWTNDDSVGHDVTKTGGPGPEFSSGDPGGMQQGDTYTEKIRTPGTIEYVCTVHPNMKGTIKVTG